MEDEELYKLIRGVYNSILEAKFSYNIFIKIAEFYEKKTHTEDKHLDTLFSYIQFYALQNTLISICTFFEDPKKNNFEKPIYSFRNIKSKLPEDKQKELDDKEKLSPKLIKCLAEIQRIRNQKIAHKELITKKNNVVPKFEEISKLLEFSDKYIKEIHEITFGKPLDIPTDLSVKNMDKILDDYILQQYDILVKQRKEALGLI